jgi:hypothetical protein
MPRHLEEDLVFILNEYARIQKFTIDQPTLPPLECKANIKVLQDKK